MNQKDTRISDEHGERVIDPIAGVAAAAGLNIPYERGLLTEMYRPEWDPSGAPLLHVHQVRMLPRVVSAWHLHTRTTDRLFVNFGLIRVVLFDDRDDSLTRGRVNEFFCSEQRPTLVTIPAGVWHGVENLSGSDSLYLNFASVAYRYDDPDHYRLEPDTDRIPFRWGHGDVSTLRLR